MSETKSEYREGKDWDERKSSLMEMSCFDLWDMISGSSEKQYPDHSLRNDLAEMILDHNLDLE